ncbi:MAG TPA: magnesium transporter CorA family protein, partial [Acidimicrobiales bacterium]|nr:magnesium transporter CorA family protein [Acidimicrobiales bacterium]
FKFHPLAIEDAEQFGQRPKFAEYEDFAQFVIYGAADDPAGGSAMGAESAEVHCLFAEKYLVTVRDGASSMTMDLVRQRAALWRHHMQASTVMLLYRIADALIDGYFPMMARFDDAIDELEEDILASPTDAQVGTLFKMKRQLVSLRKLVTPERDMFASMLAGSDDFPGMTPDAERYFRDLYDHLIRLSDLVDSYRDLLTSAVDTHLSTVSNKLNDVMKQLTILATVFLPLSFITGFFGQNFEWLTSHLGGLPVFLIFGIGTEVLAVLLLLYIFWTRGWLGSRPAPSPRPRRPKSVPPAAAPLPASGSEPVSGVVKTALDTARP